MRRLFVASVALLAATCLFAQDYTWKHVPMDGSRTGCVAPMKDNVDEALGVFKGRKYIAPSGKVYRKNSAAAKTARVVIDAQPAMARVKEPIAHSTRAMVAEYPESALTDWFVDILMAKVEALAGKKVDVGVANFGGVRIDMPEGQIILDDMLSMFPFKNQLVYVEQTGRQIRKILEEMAAGRFQILGGVRVVAEGGRLLSAEIDGKPIEDDKVYGLATISFLLGGGDGLALEKDALSVTVYKDVDIIDAILEHVYAETAAGRSIEYEMDGRVVIKDLKK